MAAICGRSRPRPLPQRGMGVSSGIGERRVYDALRLGEDRLQVVAAFEAFAVDLVDVLGARRPRGEPAGFGDHLDAADRRVVAGRPVQYARDRGTREPVGLQLFRREPAEGLLLPGAGRRLDAVEEDLAEGIAEAAVVF